MKRKRARSPKPGGEELLAGFNTEKPLFTRDEWQKEIRDMSRDIRRAMKKSPRFSSLDYGGAMLERRCNALLDSIDGIYERFGSLYKTAGAYNNDLGTAWIRLCLSPLSYDDIVSDGQILRAAAIWILDRIYESSRNLSSVYPLLPEKQELLDTVEPHEVWDPVFDEDLIESVMYVIAERNEDAASGSQSTDGSCIDDFHIHNLLLSPHLAQNGAKKNTEMRRSFDRLLALIPEERRNAAVKKAEDLFWKWVGILLPSALPLFTKYRIQSSEMKRLMLDYESVYKEINEIRKQVEKIIREDTKSRKRKFSAPVRAPFAKAPDEEILASVNVSFPALSSPRAFSVGTDTASELGRLMVQLEVLEKQSESLDLRINSLSEALDTLGWQKQTFLFDMCRRGSLGEIECRNEYGDDVASALKSLKIEDPYEPCFGFLLLAETGSDIPWLYGPGHGFLSALANVLPWGIEEYLPEEDEILYPPEDETAENQWAEDAAVPENLHLLSPADWYSLKYTDPDDDEFGDKYNLAQLFYMKTGCIMPRDTEKYRSYADELHRYGVSDELVPLLISQMAFAGAAHWRRKALNFDSVYMDYLNEQGMFANEGKQKATSAEPEDVPQDPEVRIRELEQENKRLQAETKRLHASLHDLDRQTRELRNEMNLARKREDQERRELADLRELLFHLNEVSGDDQTDTVSDDGDDIFPYNVQQNTVIFGGHETWLKILRPMLRGNIKFIAKEDLAFDVRVVRHADIIWIQHNAISHSMFYNLVDAARQYGKPVRYFGFASAEKCARQLAAADQEY